LNREHFVSRNVLEDFDASGGLRVAGFPHGNTAGDMRLSVESMSAKVLCEGHNRRLSDVDTGGGRFVTAFFDCDVGLLERKLTADLTYEFDGLLIQRWMLKFACGLIGSGHAGFGTDRFQPSPPPLEFLQVLFGIDTFPAEWGLYTRLTNPMGVSERKSLSLALYLSPPPHERRKVCGVRMELYGFTSILALETPPEQLSGTDLEGAVHRPEFFELSYPPTGRKATITVNWPSPKAGNGFAVSLEKGAPPD
jgi:hypothetical protein